MKLSPKAEASINKFIEKFKSGDLSPITSVARIRIDADAPAFKWSLSNKVMAFIQSKELDCRGFRQWEKVGRKIKKGSKAVYILRPHIIKTKDQKTEQEESLCVGFCSVPVFAASSTKGDNDLPYYEPKELPPLYDVAQKFGIDVSYVPLYKDRLGDARPDGSKIRLGSHEPHIFFHELAHAIHARIEGGLRGGQQVEQETIAEFTAVVLMDLYNIGDYTGNAWNYMKLYAKDPLQAITKSLGTVEKVLALLLNENSSP